MLFQRMLRLSSRAPASMDLHRAALARVQRHGSEARQQAEFVRKQIYLGSLAAGLLIGAMCYALDIRPVAQPVAWHRTTCPLRLTGQLLGRQVIPPAGVATPRATVMQL
jgi:hypothetical protein